MDAEPRWTTSPAQEQIAEKVIRTWRYKPIIRQGSPVELITHVQYVVRY